MATTSSGCKWIGGISERPLAETNNDCTETTCSSESSSSTSDDLCTSGSRIGTNDNNTQWPDSATQICMSEDGTLSSDCGDDQYKGQDGYYHVSPEYTSGDGEYEVYDASTLLMWHAQSIDATSIEDATDACPSFGEGWRLPSRIELVSLLDFGQWNPAFEHDSFFDEIQSSVHWTQTCSGNNGTWAIQLQSGLHNILGESDAIASAICVRGSHLKGEFVDNGDNTFVDTLTNLDWDTVSVQDEMDWQTALTACPEDWHLPSIKELLTLIIDTDPKQPITELALVPSSLENLILWSSSPSVSPDSENKVWALDFSETAFTVERSAQETANVYCIRNHSL